MSADPIHQQPIPSLRLDDVRYRYRNDPVFATAVKTLLEIVEAAKQDALWLHAAAVMAEDLRVSKAASTEQGPAAVALPLAVQLKECDRHLSAYLQSVPRRGYDLVVHASGETAHDLAVVLEELSDRVRHVDRWPINIVDSRGWWADGVVRPWHRYVQNEHGEIVRGVDRRPHQAADGMATDMTTARWFPISYIGPRKGPTQVPWDAIAPHGAQARANHGGQDLETLARRGGLSPCEFIAIMEDRPWLGGLVEEDRGRELAAELIRRH